MNVRVGDLMKYFDGVNKYLCIIVAKDGHFFIVNWLHFPQRGSYYFHERFHFSEIKSRSGWSKLS